MVSLPAMQVIVEGEQEGDIKCESVFHSNLNLQCQQVRDSREKTNNKL